MTIDAIFGLAAANFASSLVPGQNTALITSSSARHGAGPAATVILGVLAADLVWVLLAHLTLAGLLVISPDGMGVLQLLGGCILIVMGASLAWNASAAQATIPDLRFCPEKTFLCGFLVGFANPMTVVFFLSILPFFFQQAEPTTAVYIWSIVAIVVSSAAALCPYLAASLIVEKHHQTALAWLCAIALILFGAYALLWSFWSVYAPA